MRTRWGAVAVTASLALAAVAGLTGFQQGTATGPVAWMFLAKTPPMGWNSWNKFACDVSETLIKSVADAMVSSGMKDAGYQYVVIDDCWQVSRDGAGTIVPDATRFPSGMKALADYVHSKGLKFGLLYDAEPTVRDLWAKKDLGRVKGTFVAMVPPHEVVMIRVSPAP